MWLKYRLRKKRILCIVVPSGDPVNDATVVIGDMMKSILPANCYVEYDGKLWPFEELDQEQYERGVALIGHCRGEEPVIDTNRADFVSASYFTKNNQSISVKLLYGHICHGVKLFTSDEWHVLRASVVTYESRAWVSNRTPRVYRLWRRLFSELLLGMSESESGSECKDVMFEIVSKTFKKERGRKLLKEEYGSLICLERTLSGLKLLPGRSGEVGR